ncbi:DUF4232 domain-containing protein [Leucobacter sp. HY1908]
MMRRSVLWPSATAGLLWLVVGGVAQALTWFTSVGWLLQAVVPHTMPGAVWMWPGVWGYTSALLGALAVGIGTAAILLLQARGPSFGWVGAGRAWLAMILASTVVGIATDVGVLLGFGPIPSVGEGLRSQLSIASLGSYAALGAYFGVLYGWVAALVARSLDRVTLREAVRAAQLEAELEATAGAGLDPDQEVNSGGAGEGPGAGAGERPGAPGAPGPRNIAPPRRPGAFVGAVLPVLAAVALAVAYTAVSSEGARVHTRVTQAELAQAERDAAEAAGVLSVGALPDSTAEGDPVPSRDEGAPPRDPAWCSAADTTLMFDGPDAATGHRLLTLRVVNGGEESCVLEGYPDIAFADQNGHLLDAELSRGGSFMRQDAGPAAITLEPGAWASSGIGWNANSTQGELVAAQVYSALVPGDERHAWPPRTPLDIVPGASVAVSAWEPSDGPQPD